VRNQHRARNQIGSIKMLPEAAAAWRFRKHWNYFSSSTFPLLQLAPEW
jgi:hypothetical protein